MTEKKPRLPKGNMFMPDTTIKDMRSIYKKEKNAGAALRLLACIKRKEGHTLRNIGRAINCRFETVGAWLRRMHRLGLKGRYHKPKTIQASLEEFVDDIILEFFPPYTPELNPVEGQWKVQKQHAANRTYDSVNDMQESIDRMYASGEIKVVKTHDYLNAQIRT